MQFDLLDVLIVAAVVGSIATAIASPRLRTWAGGVALALAGVFAGKQLWGSPPHEEPDEDPPPTPDKPTPNKPLSGALDASDELIAEADREKPARPPLSNLSDDELAERLTSAARADE